MAYEPVFTPSARLLSLVEEIAAEGRCPQTGGREALRQAEHPLQALLKRYFGEKN